MARTRIALVAATSLVASLLNPVNAHSAEMVSPTCTQPGFVVSKGTLKWGIKQTWRSYIQGPAQGRWSLEGAVGDNAARRTSSEYQFFFDVDPATTRLVGTLDENGSLKISEAVVGTKKSQINFTAHEGKLATTLRSPYIKVEGGQAAAGSSYISYYVPGKEMTEYEKSDLTSSNRQVGTQEFGAGAASTWVMGENNTVTMKVTGMHYRPQPGTMAGMVSGIDTAFLGQYDELAPLDDATLELKVQPQCLDTVSTASLGYEDNLPAAPGDKLDANPSDPSTPESSLSVGAIVGIVIAAIVGVVGLLAAALQALAPGLIRF
ncbi:HtaA domain-containing protein [Corynebacterium sp. ES2794-CONJ1]|uniref:HtaA domain-containing protein n=1 Tax=unclassified Corynebacterium TaxID=2624378 RepID=UPI002169C31B|nr:MULTISPECIES: HtaA domain-containing protein [unclassified Corynebacterium]MCS4489532.1 HtaA domain-containing protein [Corynebacterium sp. ES2775-CONJ]MCS4531442.1 HtaA domain-containing protein [Corynebacterium sp. ES2730-CONJ]MCU9518830.1 HtaA domain-containing protein [Corynebacterium sp. ES2794-CONJ1]